MRMARHEPPAGGEILATRLPLTSVSAASNRPQPYWRRSPPSHTTPSTINSTIRGPASTVTTTWRRAPPTRSFASLCHVAICSPSASTNSNPPSAVVRRQMPQLDIDQRRPGLTLIATDGRYDMLPTLPFVAITRCNHAQPRSIVGNHHIRLITVSLVRNHVSVPNVAQVVLLSRQRLYHQQSTENPTTSGSPRCRSHRRAECGVLVGYRDYRRRPTRRKQPNRKTSMTLSDRKSHDWWPLQKHAEIPTGLFDLGLQLRGARVRARQVARRDVLVKLNPHRMRNRFAEPIHNRRSEPITRFAH